MGISCILFSIIQNINIMSDINTNGIRMLMSVAIITVIARLIYLKAVKYTYISIASPIISATSILVVPLGVFILGEKINCLQVISIICLTISIAIVSGFTPKDLKQIKEGNLQ